MNSKILLFPLLAFAINVSGHVVAETFYDEVTSSQDDESAEQFYDIVTSSQEGESFYDLVKDVEEEIPSFYDHVVDNQEDQGEPFYDAVSSHLEETPSFYQRVTRRHERVAEQGEGERSFYDLVAASVQKHRDPDYVSLILSGPRARIASMGPNFYDLVTSNVAAQKRSHGWVPDARPIPDERPVPDARWVPNENGGYTWTHSTTSRHDPLDSYPMNPHYLYGAIPEVMNNPSGYTATLTITPNINSDLQQVPSLIQTKSVPDRT